MRYALRTLRRSPGFTAIALLTLALGIGANTAIFSFVSGVLLKPLPYRDPHSIVLVWEKPPGGDRNGISTLNYLDWKNRNTVFEAMAAIHWGSLTLTGTAEPEELPGARVSAPFFAVYMLKSLGYAMTTIIALTVASQLSNIAALGLWGTLIDRYSNKAVLQISAPLFLVCTLGWTFTGLAWIGSATLYLLAVIHVLMGVATAGVALGSGNIVMKLSPAGQATAYLAASCVVTATCGAIAPVIGGLCADFFAARELTLAFTWTGGVGQVTVQVLDFHSWTFFFGLACVAGLYSLHRLSFVQETAGTTDKLLVRDLLLEAGRSIRSLSSAAGLLRVALPQSLVPPRSGEPPAE